MAGRFINFYLPFAEHGNFITSQEQAKRIIARTEEQIKLGCKGVAITYSANYDQTVRINATYQSGQWHTHTHGANQAEVISALENLLENEFKHLQYKIRIAPITTLTYSTFGGNTHEEVVVQDLQNIKALLDANWCVHGWINQVSAPHYAVGGGIAQLTPEISARIQKTLKEFANQYPG
jgi:hypothetical protein